MRMLEERFWSPDVVGEWEPSSRFDVSDLKVAEVARLVRKANADAKRDNEWVRFRSVEVEDAFS